MTSSGAETDSKPIIIIIIIIDFALEFKWSSILKWRLLIPIVVDNWIRWNHVKNDKLGYKDKYVDHYE